MALVYVLKSTKTGRHYVGSTENFERRMSEHQAGKSSFAKANRPFELIYFEEFASKKEALAREMYFKSLKGGVKIRSIINNW